MKKDIIKMIILIVILAALIASIVYVKKKNSAGIDEDDWNELLSSEDYEDYDEYDEGEDTYDINDMEDVENYLDIEESSDESTVFDDDSVTQNAENVSIINTESIEE